MRACCQALVERFGGEVPRGFDELLSLPGVGRKTANILRGNAFGLPGIGVDTHVGRLSQRLGLSAETDPDKIEADLTKVVPPAHQIRFCHLIQFHGRRVCLARKPDCPACVLLDICPFPDKTEPKEPKQPAKKIPLGVNGSERFLSSGATSSANRQSSNRLRLWPALTFLLGKHDYPLYLDTGRSSGGLTNTRNFEHGHEPTHAALATDDEPGRDP